MCIQAEHTIKLIGFIQSGKFGYEQLFKSFLFYENDTEYSSKNYIPFSTVVLKPIMQSSENILDTEKNFRKYLNGIGNVLIDLDKNPINKDIYINLFINKKISNQKCYLV
ncbi:hypothetical protein [Lysinibacillus capsici]|uniref:hypothetical protein n=1 Tax=Lysinibacillus capsici TaxID=2115968 RepID=UPI003BA8FE4E